jgi:hypothetical protein
VISRKWRAPEALPGAHGPCWVICASETSRDTLTSLLTVWLPGWGEVLPLFGSEADAVAFLRGWEPGSRTPMEASQTPRARLASALLGPLASVDRIAFDPLPGPDLQDTIRLASLCRGAFVDLVLGRGKEWSARDENDASPRLGAPRSRP